MADLPRSIPAEYERVRKHLSGADGTRRIEITVEQEFCSVDMERVTVPTPSPCPRCGYDFSDARQVAANELLEEGKR